jgi:hypothetical protein
MELEGRGVCEAVCILVLSTSNGVTASKSHVRSSAPD